MSLTILNLAGWHVNLVCQPADLAVAVTERYAAFQTTENADPLVTVEITLTGASPQAPPEVVSPVWNGEAWRLDGPSFSGRIDLVHGRGSLTFSSREPLAPLEYFVRVLCALLVYQRGGLLIHAAGLLLPTDGRVRVFMGQSGSGKSTVTALSPDAIALNDDLLLMRPSFDGWTVYGTPFWNMQAVNRGGQTAQGPLDGIYILKQDRQVYLEALSPALATAALAANCPVINGLAADLPDLLARCRDLVSVVAIRRLHFRQSPEFWQVVK